jgi:hypothetical protein
LNSYLESQKLAENRGDEYSFLNSFASNDITITVFVSFYLNQQPNNATSTQIPLLVDGMRTLLLFLSISLFFVVQYVLKRYLMLILHFADQLGVFNITTSLDMLFATRVLMNSTKLAEMLSPFPQVLFSSNCSLKTFYDIYVSEIYPGVAIQDMSLSVGNQAMIFTGLYLIDCGFFLSHFQNLSRQSIRSRNY